MLMMRKIVKQKMLLTNVIEFNYLPRDDKTEWNNKVRSGRKLIELMLIWYFLQATMIEPFIDSDQLDRRKFSLVLFVCASTKVIGLKLEISRVGQLIPEKFVFCALKYIWLQTKNLSTCTF